MITYTSSATEITDSQLRGFFVGWPSPPTSETHLKLLQQSDVVVLAMDTETHAVVGYVTALTNHVLSAYIPLLEVLPDYQHRGVGHELMRRIIEQLNSIYMIDLICAPELQPFYEAVGMQPTTGMLIRNFSSQHGAE